jgi:hypothetical protein
MVKNFIIAVWIFYVFKNAPETIDHNSSKFWQKSVSLINEYRRRNGNTFYLFKLGRFYVRDPYAYPMRSMWYNSDRHPFCWKISK